MNELPIYGLLALILLSVLSIIPSLAIIKRYSKALKKGMGYSDDNLYAESKHKQMPEEIKNPRFDIEVIQLSKEKEVTGPTFYKMKETFGYHWFVYILMCLAFSAVITTCLFYDTNFDQRLIKYYFALFTFPLVSITYVILTVGWQHKLIISGLLGFFYLFFCFYLSDGLIPFKTAAWTYLQLNLIPFLILSIVRLGKLKAVGLFVYSFILMTLGGPAFMIFYLIKMMDTNKYFNQPLMIEILLAVLLFLLIGFFFMRLCFKAVIYFYKKKWVNEWQLNADACLIIYNLCYALILYNVNQNNAILSLLGFPIYKLIGYPAFSLLRRRRLKLKSPVLLLLRVFDLGDKSRNLYERIVRHWRYAGSMNMISGPDLALATIEPHEIILFVNGKMDQSFCDNDSTIEQNIRLADTEPDLDATHRVNEFFCREDNWKKVLEKLALQSDVILMDLRKFSEKYKGCQYEIEALIKHVDLNKVVFICDEHTDLAYTKLVFHHALSNMDVTQSINQGWQHLQLYQYNHQRFNEEFKLLNILCSRI